MAYGGHVAPTLAPPAGGFKWRDDEYWNKHEGLMTQTWPHHFEGRERTKNKPMTINARTLSAANLPEMTIRPRDRPSTVPANMPSQGKRFLDHVQDYMGGNNEQPESAPSTPGRMPRATSGVAERRALSSSELGVRGAPRRRPVQHHGKFKENMYYFKAGMAMAEPLNPRTKERQAFGLTPFSQMKARAAGGGAIYRMDARPQMPQGFQVTGLPVSGAVHQQ